MAARGLGQFPICIWTSDSGGDISYLELWRATCLAEQNRLGNFGRGRYEEYFVKLF